MLYANYYIQNQMIDVPLLNYLNFFTIKQRIYFILKFNNIIRILMINQRKYKKRYKKEKIKVFLLIV